MSDRPSAAATSPPSERARRLSDSRASALIFCWTLAAPPPRWRGSSWAAYRLAAWRSHGWVIPVKLARPG